MPIMSNFVSSFVNFEIPNWFDHQHLTGMLRGIEKEGLRVKPDGFWHKPRIQPNWAPNLLIRLLPQITQKVCLS